MGKTTLSRRQRSQSTKGGSIKESNMKRTLKIFLEELHFLLIKRKQPFTRSASVNCPHTYILIEAKLRQKTKKVRFSLYTV